MQGLKLKFRIDCIPKNMTSRKNEFSPFYLTKSLLKPIPKTFYMPHNLTIKRKSNAEWKLIKIEKKKSMIICFILYSILNNQFRNFSCKSGVGNQQLSCFPNQL